MSAHQKSKVDFLLACGFRIVERRDKMVIMKGGNVTVTVIRYGEPIFNIGR